MINYVLVIIQNGQHNEIFIFLIKHNLNILLIHDNNKTVQTEISGCFITKLN